MSTLGCWKHTLRLQAVSRSGYTIWFTVSGPGQLADRLAGKTPALESQETVVPASYLRGNKTRNSAALRSTTLVRTDFHVVASFENDN